jgi:GNAT superfamily N-acetyltransferase
MTPKIDFHIRDAREHEFNVIGKLLVEVYSGLDGFPTQKEQPEYYRMLLHVGELTVNPGVELIVAITPGNRILGAVVNFSDMKHYGSGGTASSEMQSGGFRLLAVHPDARGSGIGKELTLECIRRAKSRNQKQVIIHTTKAMMRACHMYEKIGFKRLEDLDFLQGDLPVFGFRYPLI